MTKKQLEEKVKNLEKNLPRYDMENLTIIGNKWDGSALQTIQTVADALKNLTELFKKQDNIIKLDSELYIKQKLEVK